MSSDVGRDGPRSLLPWLGVAGCALGFMLLAVIVSGPGRLPFDVPVTALLRGLPIPVDVWLLATHAGDVAKLAVAVVLVACLLWVRQYRMAAVVMVVLVATALATDDIKDLVQRQRPPEPLVSVSGYSFPSGHSITSAVTYGLVALVIWRSRLSRRVRGVSVVLLGALIGSVGLSRIALGVHYPSDVLASWLAATAIVAGVALATRAASTARAGPRSRTAPTATPGR